jgi:hypothetical protein
MISIHTDVERDMIANQQRHLLYPHGQDILVCGGGSVRFCQKAIVLCIIDGRRPDEKTKNEIYIMYMQYVVSYHHYLGIQRKA